MSITDHPIDYANDPTILRPQPTPYPSVIEWARIRLAHVEKEIKVLTIERKGLLKMLQEETDAAHQA